MEHEIILIAGLHDAAGAQALEDALTALAGVTSAEVDLGAATVDVTYDPEFITIEAVANCIEARGFVVVA